MADIITLKQLCAELKIDPREARERLRAAARDAKKHPELAKMPNWKLLRQRLNDTPLAHADWAY